MAEAKITKRVAFEELLANETVSEDIKEILVKEIAHLDKRKEADNKRAAEKREAGDELRSEILAVLTNEYQTTTEILEALGQEGLTINKIAPRLAQLVNLGLAQKGKTKIEGKVKVVYALPTAE